jgi:hypothetical protein
MSYEELLRAFIYGQEKILATLSGEDDTKHLVYLHSMRPVGRARRF